METRRKRGSEHSWGEGVIQADPEVGGDLVMAAQEIILEIC